MVELHRFDVDYLDEEGWLKHIPCDDGDYVLAEDALALQVKVKELEEFTKHEYMSMKNWQEEKAALKARVEKLTAALDRIEHWPKHIDGRDFSTWVMQTARAALKQEGK